MRAPRSLHPMTATETDLTAADVAWNLEPLVEEQGVDGVDAHLAPRGGPTGGRDRTGPGHDRDTRRGRARRRDGARRRAPGAPRSGGLLRRAALHRRHDRPRARRADAAGRGGVDGDRDAGDLPRARMGRRTRRAGRGAPRRRPARVLRPPPALRPPLPAPPAHRARGEDPRREGRHRRERVVPPVQRADLCDHGRARRCDRARSSRDCRGSRSPDRSARARRGRGRGHRGSGAGAADAGVRVQHAAGRQGDRRPPAHATRVDREPEPRQRGERRIGAGARRRGRRAATTSPSGGTRSRRSYSASIVSPTTTGWRASPTPKRSSAGTRRAGWCSDAYASFSPELADVGDAVLRRVAGSTPRCDRASGPGAFCAYTVPSHHPYLLLNWTSSRRDVLTLAHELGHGLHAYLAREQGVFHMSTPLTLAETASVFGETVTFGRLLEATPDPDARLALLAESLEGQIATVFRQIAMNRFEDRVHTHRREVGELSVDDFGEALGRDPDRDARRRGGDHRGLPHMVVLHPALHRHARVRVRVRVRPAPRAVGLPPVRGARRRLRPRVPGAARRGRVEVAARSWARSSTAISPTRGSGSAGSRSSSNSSRRPRPRPSRPVGVTIPAP